MGDPILREVRSEDDAAVAAIIRTVMSSFGADGPGFAIHDPEVSAMTAAYDRPGAAYFVITTGVLAEPTADGSARSEHRRKRAQRSDSSIESEGRVIGGGRLAAVPLSVHPLRALPSAGRSASTRIVGGGGVAPLDGGPADTCEIRKMYFLPEARGLGLGKKLLAHCLETARALGYRRAYLETLTGMDAAQALYAKMGFTRIDGPRGATGHGGCDRFYEREL